LKTLVIHYLSNSWSRVYIEKLIVAQLVKMSPFDTLSRYFLKIHANIISHPASPALAGYF